MPFWTQTTPADLSSTCVPGENTNRRLGVKASEKSRKTMRTSTTAVVSQGPLLPMPVVSQIQSDPTFRSRGKSAYMYRGLRTHWAAFKKRLGTGTAPSTSSVLEDIICDDPCRHPRRVVVTCSDEEVDEIIVDHAWTEEIKYSSAAQSDSGMSPEKLGEGPLVGNNADQESLPVHSGFWAAATPLVMLRWRLWPATLGFFRLRFIDEKSEAHYRKERWFFRKKLALWSAFFLVANWILATAFVPRPFVLPDKIFYYGVGPLLAFPTLIMVMYDFPRDRCCLYQTILTVATWSWAIYQVVFIYLCGYYTGQKTHSHFTCGSKDFLSTFYYTSALQTIALFGLNLDRFPALLGALSFFITSSALILPDRVAWVRNVIIFISFQAFLLYVHYMRDNVERRLYTLRDQLKVQFRATQKAQINERKMEDSKRRLTSYVRVPLNTALLAVQNMDACGAVPKTHELEFKALEGSLNMMSKVLNDVLDFHRMDSGRFESLNKPYPFHQVMRSLFIPLRLDTDSRQQELVTQLDRTIDDVALRALSEAAGESEDKPTHYPTGPSDFEGIVVGDETRLRQIITNLAGNACKFTPTGGKITISTKLIIPTKESLEVNGSPYTESRKISSAVMDDAFQNELSVDHLSQHNRGDLKSELECIVVRIEVSDTGCGIHQKDMEQGKLFTAFNQTEQGRQQGGKGTGLGLALVRQIVKLSGGRLGVQSKVGLGSTFWVELPLVVGRGALSPTTLQSKRLSLDRRNSDWGPYPPPPTPDIEGRSSPTLWMNPSATVLEHVMNPEGLVQLMPRKIGEPDRDSLRTKGASFTNHERSRSSGDWFCTSSAQDIRRIWSAPQDNSIRTQHDSMKPLLLNSDVPRDNSTVYSCSSTAAGPISNSGSILSPTDIEPGLRVLVVDDDRMTRMLMERMLERLRCVVTTAANGQQALKLLMGGTSSNQAPLSDEVNGLGIDDSLELGSREVPEDVQQLQLRGNSSWMDESRFAIVFLDNQMPVMSGLEMVRRLRSMGRQDLVVGVTGNALLPDQEEYLGAGVDHVLTKPVREENVRAMLTIADERRRSNCKPLLENIS